MNDVEDPVDRAYATTSLPPIGAGAGRGRTPISPEEWSRRRPELLSALASAVYGETPVGGGLRSLSLVSEALVSDGAAIRREYAVVVHGPRGTHSFDLLLHLPAHARAPVPVFVGLNFHGNQATSPEPGLHSTTARRAEAVVEPEPGARSVRVVGWDVVDATGPLGSDRAMWPVAEIVKRGYGLATAHNSQIEEDRPFDRAPGVGALFGEDASWGVVGMWAWGLSRMLDGLERIPDVDSRAVIAVGHSRLGKAALWAAAQDERFHAAVSNDSGCGGASLFRHLAGESLGSITRVFPHWFVPSLRDFAGREDELPVDQHQLLAAIAPRAVHVASASEDRWADPRGEFLAVVHASGLFASFGAERILPVDSDAHIDIPPAQAIGVPTPDPGRAIGGRLSYHLREGGHAMVLEDWMHFLDFADRVIDAHESPARHRS